MTLPQQEIDRIKDKYPRIEGLEESDFALRVRNSYIRNACVNEAFLWFKRMVILLEEQAMIFIGKTSWKYFASTGRWSSPHHKNQPTTPELIELFINSLNDEK